ncbi:hypothetical protein [Methylobacterium flocculans]|uniref:hypothetical protein n=1 Tax=Methylobacterium flocculans TaxID=2984843 RepID=UPI0021F37E1E|nr:hypothetical protein [Methylobacterium sp. FF17]
MTRVPITAPLRAAIEAAMRGTRRPVSEIAAETGVSCVTIRSWNRRHGWRVTSATSASGFDPAGWHATRRAAVARLYAQPWLDIGDLSLAMGVPRRQAETLFAGCGLAGRKPGEVAEPTGPDTDPRGLRAALRAHIARQIVRFDAALNAEDGTSDPKSFDSARVLRDLGGLKRLLDEADGDEQAHAARRETGDGTAGGAEPRDGDAAAGRDLPALRAEIARRAAAYGAGAAPGAAGEPAAAPDPGAGD